MRSPNVFGIFNVQISRFFNGNIRFRAIFVGFIEGVYGVPFECVAIGNCLRPGWAQRPTTLRSARREAGQFEVYLWDRGR